MFSSVKLNPKENTPLIDEESSRKKSFHEVISATSATGESPNQLLSSLENGDLGKIGVLLRDLPAVKNGSLPKTFVNDVLTAIQKLETSKKEQLFVLGNKVLNGEIENLLDPGTRKEKEKRSINPNDGEILVEGEDRDDSSQKGKNQLPMPDPQDIGLIFDVYKTMPKTVKKAIASKVPAEYEKILPMVERIPTDVVVNIIPKGYKMIEDIAERKERNAKKLCDAENMNESQFLSGVEEVEMQLEEPFSIDIAADIFEDIQSIPHKVREDMIQMIPCETKEDQNIRSMAKHAMEATEGLTKNDIKEVFVTYQKQEKIKHKNEAKLNTLRGEEKEKLEKEMETQAVNDQFAMVKKLVGIALMSQSRRLLSWMLHSPLSMRVLGFLCGVLLFITNIFAFFMNLFSGKFLAFCLSFWILIFSLVIIVVEINIAAMQQYIIPYLNKYFQFLGTVTGRGGFLIFTGLYSMSLITKAQWQNYALFGAGFLSVFIGVIEIILGNIAFYRFKSMKKKMTSTEKVLELFEEADADHSGELDMEELQALCNKLGTTLDSSSIELILRAIDTDHNGTLSFEEFQAWWSAETDNSVKKIEREVNDNTNHLDTSNAVISSKPINNNKQTRAEEPLLDLSLETIKEKAKNINKPPTILKLLNVLVSLCAITAGISGAIVSFERIGFKDGVFPFIMNIWFAFAGVFILLTESGIWCLSSSPLSNTSNTICYNIIMCGGESRTAFTDHYFKILDTIIGRGAFYLFFGTVGFSMYAKGVGQWQLYSVFTGLAIFVLGVVNMIVGFSNQATLNLMREKLKEGELRSAFDRADKDGNGELDMSELVTFCTTLEIEMNHGEWELMIQQLDRDNSGTVSFEEFQHWWLQTLSY